MYHLLAETILQRFPVLLFGQFRKRKVPVLLRLLEYITVHDFGQSVVIDTECERVADAAVADGMPRAQAYRFAAQAVLGSAKMVLETGKHPGELKDMVCSPKGTTIEAVRVLEEKGLRSAVFEAMKACVKKGREV